MIERAIKVILLSHGPLAGSLITSSELIIGKTHNCFALELNYGDSIEEYEIKLMSLLNKKNDYIILTDLFGGSPNHVVAKVMHRLSYPPNLTCFVGVNLPLILEIISLKETLNYHELVNHIKIICKETIFELYERLQFE